ncbi:ABC transporter permease subunit [Paraburkholderia xenovorans]|uniref:ABC transporter permease subunit n=1 Tax=Paraburkholderia xenovorans TaxID=36873 RepID=UPI001559BF08|nr:ABC transporter permease subunit [Paraburkholderia xenovorans]NPT39132.1 ABC transporter permease subunit [Paraburkholderia xenovorans]
MSRLRSLPDRQETHSSLRVFAPRATTPRRVARPIELTRLILPIAVLAIWQLASSAGLIDPHVLEAPLDVGAALVDLTRSGVLWDSLVASLQRAVLGFLIGGSVGLSLGLVAGLSRIGERTYDALLQMLRMVPFLALIPLFVIWFGVDEKPKILLIAIACVFPVYLNTFSGVRNVDAKLIEAARVFGMSQRAIAVQIVLPLAMPAILVGVRYAMGTALLALVAAEQVNATSGIGYLALNPRAVLRTDIILGVVLVYSLLGLAIDALLRAAERIALPWHRTLITERRR